MTRRYPAYRDSGIDWMGDVPRHWVTCRADEVLRSSSDSVDAEALNGRTVFHYSIPVVQETGTGAYEDGDEIESSKGVVREPQVLVSKLNPRKGTVCIAVPADELTVCSGEFIPLVPISADLRYVFYTAMSDVFRQRLEARVESATKSHQRVLPSDITKFPWAVPPLLEQTAIAAFLDRETAKIDALVAEQRRLIDLLKEKRQAVISHAVTRGLNPDAKLKPSGVDWLGDVPEGWDVASVRRCSIRVVTGSTPSNESREAEQDEAFPWYTPGDFGDDLLLSESARSVPSSVVLSGELRVFPASSVLVVSIGATLGKVGYSEMPCSANQQINAIIPNDKVTTRFLAYSLAEKAAVMRFLSNASTIGIMNQEKTKEIFLALPPVQEQADIVRYLDNRTKELTALSEIAETAITLLQERRAALISAAVTGKIDVRDLVPNQTEAA